MASSPASIHERKMASPRSQGKAGRGDKSPAAAHHFGDAVSHSIDERSIKALSSHNDALRKELEHLRGEVHRMKVGSRYGSSAPPSAPASVDGGDEHGDAGLDGSSRPLSGAASSPLPEEMDPSESASQLLGEAGGAHAPADLLLVSLMMQMHEMQQAIQRGVKDTIVKDVHPAVNAQLGDVAAKLSAHMADLHSVHVKALADMRTEMNAAVQEAVTRTAAAMTEAVIKAFNPVTQDVRSVADTVSHLKQRLAVVETNMTQQAATQAAAAAAAHSSALKMEAQHAEAVRAASAAAAADRTADDATHKALATLQQAVSSLAERTVALEGAVSARMAAATVDARDQMTAAVQHAQKADAAQHDEVMRALGALQAEAAQLAEGAAATAAGMDNVSYTRNAVQASVEHILAVQTTLKAIQREQAGVAEALQQVATTRGLSDTRAALQASVESLGERLADARMAGVDQDGKIWDAVAVAHKDVRAGMADITTAIAGVRDGVQGLNDKLQSVEARGADSADALAGSAALLEAMGRDAGLAREAQAELTARVQAVQEAVEAAASTAQAATRDHVASELARVHTVLQDDVSSKLQSLAEAVATHAADTRTAVGTTASMDSSLVALRDTSNAIAAALASVKSGVDFTSANTEQVRATLSVLSKSVEAAAAASTALESSLPGQLHDAVAAEVAPVTAATQELRRDVTSLLVSVKDVSSATQTGVQALAGDMKTQAAGMDALGERIDAAAVSITDTVPERVVAALSPALTGVETAQSQSQQATSALSASVSEQAARAAAMERVLHQLVLRPIVDEELRNSVAGVLAGVTQLATIIRELQEKVAAEATESSSMHQRSYDVSSARLRTLEEAQKQSMEVVQRTVAETKKNVGAVADALKLGMHARGQEAKEIQAEIGTLYTALTNLSSRIHAMATQRVPSSAVSSPALNMLTGMGASSPVATAPATPAPAPLDETANMSTFATPYHVDEDEEAAAAKAAEEEASATARARAEAAEKKHQERMLGARGHGGNRRNSGSTQGEMPVEVAPAGAATAPRSKRNRRGVPPLTPAERERLDKLYGRYGMTPRGAGSVSGDDASALGSRSYISAPVRRVEGAPDASVTIPGADGDDQWVTIRFPPVTLAEPTSSPDHAMPLPPARSRSRERAMMGLPPDASSREPRRAASATTPATNASTTRLLASRRPDSSKRTAQGANGATRGDITEDDAEDYMAAYPRGAARRGSAGSTGDGDAPAGGAPKMVLYA